MRLVVARIGKAHGLGGDVTVEVRTDDPDTRLAAGAVLDTDPPDRGPLTIAAAHWHSGRLLLRLAGIESRSAAEALRGTLLVVEGATLPPIDDPDEFYDHQLEGLAVELVSGERLGVLREVLHLPGGDLLAVATDDDREVLIPFLAAMVPTVDVPGGRVVVDPPEGLLDLSQP